VAASTAAGGSATAVEEGAACDRARLPGLWTSSSYSIRMGADGRYEAAGAPNMMSIDVVGTWAVDGCTVRFTDTGGDYACPASQVGTFTFTVSATTLRFTVVSDACDGRRLAVDGAVMARGTVR
jgi:hypothetical protein